MAVATVLAPMVERQFSTDQLLEVVRVAQRAVLAQTLQHQVPVGQQQAQLEL
jgi:hypothetical protein